MIANAEISVCVVRKVKITTVSKECVAVYRLGIPTYMLFILIMLFQYSSITHIQLVADVKVFSIINFDRYASDPDDVYV
jgi:hypothetical protein|tara:strand:+ start:286 stop:522 length:237 start_codon:yes stop_codon:yes gene_type:complete